MKVVLISLLLLNLLEARVVEGTYKVRFGLFGKVAKAIARLENNETNYKATLDIKAVGIAKYLSKNRVEYYTSEGTIKDGIYKPLKFYKMVKTDKKHYIKEYNLDYSKKEINYTREDIIKKKKSNEKLNYFPNNDLMTIFLNMDNEVDLNKTKQTIQVVAQAQSRRFIELEIPKGEKKSEIKSYLKAKNDKLLIATINQKIFSSSKGELLLSLDNHNVAHKAILKDVLLFGDIRGELVSYKIKK